MLLNLLLDEKTNKRLDYSSTVNGVKYEFQFNLIADLAALSICPARGISDCGNEFTIALLQNVL
jgi:hypothetical protein